MEETNNVGHTPKKCELEQLKELPKNMSKNDTSELSSTGSVNTGSNQSLNTSISAPKNSGDIRVYSINAISGTAETAHHQLNKATKPNKQNNSPRITGHGRSGNSSNHYNGRKNSSHYHDNFKNTYIHKYPPVNHEDTGSRNLYQEEPYFPDIICKDYRVTFVSQAVAIHMQSPQQQKLCQIMRNKLDRFWFVEKPKPISELSSDKNAIYAAYYNGDIYRARIIKPSETKPGFVRYLCSNVDTGYLFYVELRNFYDLPEELKSAEELCAFRYLKDVRIPYRYSSNKENRSMMHAYVSKLLIGKNLSVVNPSNLHVDIYHMNDHMNTKIHNGVLALFAEPVVTHVSSSNPQSPLLDSYQGSESSSPSLCLIPPETGRNMDSIRKSMYIQNISSHGEAKGNSNAQPLDICLMSNLLSINYDRRNRNLEMIGEDSVISRASNYVLHNSTFYSEVDDLLSKGKELLMGRHSFMGRTGAIRIEKILNDFYIKRHLVNVPEIKSTLQGFLEELLTVCTPPEIQSAKLERAQRESRDPDQSFYTFISQFITWKKQYTVSQSRCDELLACFATEQKQFVHWIESIIEMDPNSTPQMPSFTYAKQLQQQLQQEKNLASKEKWIAMATLMTIEELECRLKKINGLSHVSAEVDSRFNDCRYQRNKQFSNETSVPLLSFIKPPKVLAPETRCFVICDVLRELSKYHLKGLVYGMLNPHNVLIIEQGQAILRERSQVEAGEPFPPWQFTAPECHRPGCIATPAADSYSLGQFILWLACVQSANNFDEIVRRIKKSCPIFDRIAGSDPRGRPTLPDIQQEFSLSIFPKAFGVKYCDSYNRVVTPNHNTTPPDNKNFDSQITILSRNPTPPLANSPPQSPSSKKRADELEKLGYEMSLMRELQDSDSEGDAVI